LFLVRSGAPSNTNAVIASGVGTTPTVVYYNNNITFPGSASRILYGETNFTPTPMTLIN
jgi:hypothetical protein